MKIQNWIHGMSIEVKEKDMKTVQTIIKEMVDKYPNDMELGSRIRAYIKWLYNETDKDHSKDKWSI